MLGHVFTKRSRGGGLPDDTIDITFTGSAGQSFGAFVPRGVTMRLVGDANDYVGKGLSGGRIIVRPNPVATFDSHENVIAGNVLLYGATSGEAFVRGVVGERFAVRNSGATAVVEGVGDHGCEYMTGGLIVVLGQTGRNFAAGMSGGVAYVIDLDPLRVNTDMVEIEALDDADKATLESLVRKHGDESGSPLALSLLESWATNVERFGKIMPRDYKRVLAARAEAEREGLDVFEHIMAVSNG
jgi:glutamate synthase (NADPH/NADH) large chain